MNEPKTQAVATTPAPIYLSKMAPPGIDGRAWAKVLKQQLLASKSTEPTDEELLYFAQVSKATGLDPTKREIYGIYRRPNKESPQKLTIQTGIDGFRVVAGRTPGFGGSKEPEFVYDPEVKITIKQYDIIKTVPNIAKVTVMKVVGDRVLDTTRTARWMDYYPGDGAPGSMWRKFPETMLAKVAEAQALRAAFPNFAGVYLSEEVGQQPQIADELTDMERIAQQIKNTKTLDELMALINGLSIEQQKQVIELANARQHELATEEEASDAAPAKNA